MTEHIEKYIDHTLLKANATTEQIKNLCSEAAQYHFASVCINPVHVAECAEFLAGTGVNVCTVIGFPLGANTSEIKAAEAAKAIADGAQEVDMVINIGAAKAGDFDAVQKDVEAVRAATPSDHVLKVIIEACLLTDEEKVEVCRRCVAAKADFVKTSTGFSTSGATVEDVALMAKTVGNAAKVKAAGGIRTRETAEAMIAAGASRLGTSNGVQIVNG